ncbi:MAG: chain length determinant protein (polysaccharide antigen chain regulator) [Candidatus Endobugula sp.]
MSDNTNIQRDDEIDLVELIVNLWREKLVIILSIIVITSLGSTYAFYKERIAPVYETEVELLIPSHADLSTVNRTENFNIEPEKAFTLLLRRFSSSNHNLQVNDQIRKKLGVETRIPNTSFREIIYKKKANALSADIYSARYSAENKESLTLLLKTDLELATRAVRKAINDSYLSSLQNELSRLKNIQLAEIKILEGKLNARKAYILLARENEINKLQEALNVARALKLENPTTLSKLAGDTSRAVNIKNIISSPDMVKNNLVTDKRVTDNSKVKESTIPYISHLERKDYLRGEKLLSAEIKNLQALSNDVFFDDEIVMIEAKKGLLGANVALEKLRLLINEPHATNSLNFYNEHAETSLLAPKKDKTKLIIVISILFGGMLGVFIAIGKIIARKYKSKP